MTAITVVTPWLNARELIPEYVRALDHGLRTEDRCIIVDNASDPPIRLGCADVEIHLTENRGFSPACNIGLRECETEAIVWLNNDIRMSSPDWLDTLRAHIRPGRLVGPDLVVSGHTAVDGRPIPYIDGWCVGGMTEELRAIGGWDESLEEPSYYGDNILSVRAKAAGMKLVQVPIGLTHLRNWSTRRTNVDAISARNRAKYEAVVRGARVAA